MTELPDNPHSEAPLSKSALPIVLPDLGAAGETVRVSAWFIEPGDSIEPGEPILEVMIAGVTCDVPATASGIIVRVDRPLDAVVAPGATVAWFVPSAP